VSSVVCSHPAAAGACHVQPVVCSCLYISGVGGPGTFCPLFSRVLLFSVLVGRCHIRGVSQLMSSRWCSPPPFPPLPQAPWPVRPVGPQCSACMRSVHHAESCCQACVVANSWWFWPKQQPGSSSRAAVGGSFTGEPFGWPGCAVGTASRAVHMWSEAIMFCLCMRFQSVTTSYSLSVPVLCHSAKAADRHGQLWVADSSEGAGRTCTAAVPARMVGHLTQHTAAALDAAAWLSTCLGFMFGRP
jgi:hypothetical protein